MKPKKKILSIYTGTDVVMCAPTHPFACVTAAVGMVEKIEKSNETEFYIKTNSVEAVAMLSVLCPSAGIEMKFYINDKPATHEEVIADFDRGLAYLYHYQHKIEFPKDKKQKAKKQGAF